MTRWLVLIFKLDREPTAPRMAVWRALKKLDGGYLQDGAFAVRSSPLADISIANIAHDVRNYGGEALVLRVSDVDDERLMLSKLGQTEEPQRSATAKRRTRR